ncbi:MAG: metal-sensing transcriptional repressor [Acholeplasmatales bacterium]|nr:metal-sensing transcriptional repressor [Acholeplasmatales bacterium]
MQYKLLIDGMKCANCKKHIIEIIEKLPNVSSADVSLDTNEATIEATSLDIEELKTKIEESGKYKVYNETERYKLHPRDLDAKKKLINRMKRMVGQLNGIMKMIEDDRYCDDVLIQLSAVDKSIKSLANSILEEHMHSCVIESLKNGNEEAIDEIIDLFKRFQ